MSDPDTGPVARAITQRLQSAFSPQRLVVNDDSASHAGHAGHDARGESHFGVEIVADAFAGRSRVDRQRMVNSVLADLLRDRVHALTIKARTPAETAA